MRWLRCLLSRIFVAMSTDWLDVSDTAPRIAYTATASQTLFTVPFAFFEDADLLVYQNDVLLTLATNYTVTGAEVEAGGTVTLLVGATVGDRIVIVRDVAIVQTTHIPPSGPLDIPAVNIQFSKLIAIDQQLADLTGRTVHLANSDDTVSMELPLLAERKGKMWAWDAGDGSLVASTHTTAEMDSIISGALTVDGGFGDVNIIGTMLALKALTPVAGAFVYVQGRTADGDGGQGIFAWKTGNYSAQVAIDTTSAVYAKADSIAATVGCWLRQFDGQVFWSAWTGTVRNDVAAIAANSTKIVSLLATSAIESVDQARMIMIEPGVKFNRTLLTPMPKRAYLRFYPDDDARQNPFTTRASSEMITLASNANTDGIVNEWRFEGAFNPGLTINNLKDMPGHDAYLGVGQVRIPTGVSSSKTSIIMEDEYVSTFSIISESYGANPISKYNGTGFTANRKRIVLTMGTTAALANVVGAMLYGRVVATSVVEAMGYFVSKTGTTVTLDWIYSKFAVGLELFDGAGGPYPVITGVGAMAVTVNNPFYFGHETPAITLGFGPGYAITDFTVAGRQTLTPNGTPSWNTVETVTNAALVFANNLPGAPTLGRQIVLNAADRLVAVNGTTNGTGSAAIGHIDAVGAYCNFTNSASAGVPSGSFNVASVVRNSTGLYTINFITNLLNTNYSTAVTLGNIGDECRINATAASSISVQNYNRGTGAVADLLSGVQVVVIGGK